VSTRDRDITPPVSDRLKHRWRRIQVEMLRLHGIDGLNQLLGRITPAVVTE